jgi:hypothetical protein
MVTLMEHPRMVRTSKDDLLPGCNFPKTNSFLEVPWTKHPYGGDGTISFPDFFHGKKDNTFQVLFLNNFVFVQTYRVIQYMWNPIELQSG